MNSVIISPHNDDSELFASIVCLRFKPLVMVVTDSFVQYERGQTDITAHRRRDETRAACKVLGVECTFVGIADDREWSPHALNSALDFCSRAHFCLRMGAACHADVLFKPAYQGGNRWHDLLNQVYWNKMGGGVVIEYATYAKDEWFTPLPGGVELVPTPEEVALKERALACYTSQAWQGHFKAVREAGYKEYLSRLP